MSNSNRFLEDFAWRVGVGPTPGHFSVGYSDLLSEQSGEALAQAATGQASGKQASESAGPVTSLAQQAHPPLPRRVRDELDRCLALGRAGDYDAALAGVDALIADYQQLALLENIAGTLHASAADFAGATQRFERAIAIDPGFSAAHNNLGLALFAQGRDGAAIEHYNAALKADPHFAEALSNLGLVYRKREQYATAANFFERALEITPGYAVANEGLAGVLEALGDIDNAVERYGVAGASYAGGGRREEALKCYEHVVRLRPDISEGHEACGIHLAGLKRNSEAIACLREALRRNPDNESAAFRLAALLQEPASSTPPRMIKDQFDHYAARFDQSLVNDLGYSAPALLKQVLTTRGLSREIYPLALDLGCGTGLAGVEFRELCEVLEGIDLSEAMLERARARGVYDALHTAEVVHALEAFERPIDLFIATDTLVYIGDLEPLFSAIKKTAADGAQLLVTTEHFDHGSWTLQRSYRFAHSQTYVEQVARKAGFALQHFEVCDLRLEHGKWLKGGVYILQA